MSQGEQCPICQGPANRVSRMEHWLEPNVLFPYYQCPTCGDFVMPDLVRNWWLNNARKREHRLSAFVRERQIHQTGPPLFLCSLEGFTDRPPYAVLIEDAIGAFPCGVPERLDCTLANLARMKPVPGSEVELVPKRDYPVGFAEDETAFCYIARELERKRLLDVRHGDRGEFHVMLTAPGWERVAGLEAPRAHSTARQAFVAMSFADEVKEAYEHGIKPAVEDAGYRPLQMGYLQHNDRIDDRIIAEIRKSQFLVADFTGHRNGVYLEAGFALGLGIPVIWTVRKDHLKDCHFDSRQYNHIDWENPEDLRQRLRARIEATIIPPRS